ncbi:MAG TPA: hypothetical protein VK421_21335 [Pyrinomonadaceae bacterium]|nr:hypothetical protein [Pyrinomonadaceae bacterium]
MLFVETRTLNQHVDGATRTLLLEKLQGRGLVPLVRSARLHLYELALEGANRAHDMESAVAARTEIEGDTPYVRGELFCADDHAHFLIFTDGEGEQRALRAGIVYEPDTSAAREKLEAFCRSVSDALAESRGGLVRAEGEGENGAGGRLFEWEDAEPRVPEGFRRFAAAQDEAPLFASRGEMVEGWLRSSGLLEDGEARRALRRLHEAHQEGRGAAIPTGGEADAVPESLLGKFSESGLIRREILVSCRKDGRALFRLPSPDALSVLVGAICSECGASIADERAEEIIVPTSLVATLLQDASWLTTHLRTVLTKLGVPDAQIAARQTTAEGDVQMMANVAGEAFFLLARDGDWAGANARRALEELAHAEAAHLVVVSTAKIQDDARQRLREFARRRTQAGRELELILVEGMESLASELQPALERASTRSLSAELWQLDTTLGMDVGFMLAARFRMMRAAGALRDMAASAASAVAGSLAEV